MGQSSGMTKSGDPQMKLNSQEEGLSIIQKTLKFVTGKYQSRQYSVAKAQLSLIQYQAFFLPNFL
jgi:hypothetical protein